MDEKKLSRNQKKRPFKQTKELVRLALNEGWTQQDIAKRCRTQQSVVSEWKKGTKFGSEEHLKPLLELFGYKLRRTSFRLYSVYKAARYSCPLPFIHWDEMLMAYRDLGICYEKFEGPVLLNFVLWVHSGNKSVKPEYRLCVHAAGRGTFHLLLLVYVAESSRDPRKDENWVVFQRALSINQTELICAIDFLSRSFPCPTISRFQGQKQLGYLIRSALMNHGYPVNDVVTHPASW